MRACQNFARSPMEILNGRLKARAHSRTSLARPTNAIESVNISPEGVPFFTHQLLLYHEEYHSLPFTNHHFPLYMSLHILLLIMRCEFRFGNLQEENQCKFKSNDPNAIESVNISPEPRSPNQCYTSIF